MRSKNLLPVQIKPPSPSKSMERDHQSQDKTMFEKTLKYNIETSLRLSTEPHSDTFSSLFSNFASLHSMPSSRSKCVKSKTNELDHEVSHHNALQISLANSQRKSSVSPKRSTSYQESLSHSSSKSGSSLSAKETPSLQTFLVRPNVSLLQNQIMQHNSKNTECQDSPSLLAQHQVEQIQQNRIEQLERFQRLQALQSTQRDQSDNMLSRKVLPESVQQATPTSRPVVDLRFLNSCSRPTSCFENTGNALHSQRSNSSSIPAVSTVNPNNQQLATTQLVEGYCMGGKDIRLVSVERDCKAMVPYPNGFILLALKTNMNNSDINNVVVISLNLNSFPSQDSSSQQELSAQCIGCGENSLHTFIQLSNHIRLKSFANRSTMCLSSKQLISFHALCYLIRDPSQNSERLIRYPPFARNQLLQEKRQFLIPNPHSPLVANGSSSILQRNILNSKLLRTMNTTNVTSAPISEFAQILPMILPNQNAVEYYVTKIISDPKESTDSDSSKRCYSRLLQGEAISVEEEPPLKRLVQKETQSIDCITVPVGLATAAERKPIIVFLHSPDAIPPIKGDLKSVMATKHMTYCLINTSAQALKKLNIEEISSGYGKWLLVITTQYLSSLGPSEIWTQESFSSALLRTKLNLSKDKLSGLNRIDSTQIISFAKIVAAASGGLVEVMLSRVSLADGISRCLRALSSSTTSIYQIVVYVTDDIKKELYFHVIVTGKMQCHALGNKLLSHNQRLLSIDRSLVSHNFLQLKSLLSVPSLDVPAFYVKNSFASKTSTCYIQNAQHSFCTDCYARFTQYNTNTALALSAKVNKLFETHPCIELACFTSLRFVFLLPSSTALYSRTVESLSTSGILSQFCETSLPVSAFTSQVVITMDSSSKQKLVSICKQWENSSTLLILFQFDAHSSSSSVEARAFLDSDAVVNSSNIVLVQCSSTPYSLLTDHSRIPIKNEVFGDSSTYNIKTTSLYFEANKTCCTSLSITFDPKFELHKDKLLLRFGELNMSVIACELLMNQYRIAIILWSAKKYSSKIPINSQRFASPLINQMIQDLLESYEETTAVAIVVRVALPLLAATFYEAIKQTRDELNLQNAFEVLLYNDNKPNVSLSSFFLQRLQKLNTTGEDWVPKSLRDLAGIPCLVVYERFDFVLQPMPQSLKYLDLRLAFEGQGFLYRAKVEKEMSIAATLCCSKIKNTLKLPTLSHITTNTDTLLDNSKVMSSSRESYSENVCSKGSIRPPKNGLAHFPFDRKQNLTNKLHAELDFIGLAMKEANLPPATKVKSEPENVCQSEINNDFNASVTILPVDAYNVINSEERSRRTLLSLPPDPLCKWKEPLHPIIKQDFSSNQISSYYRMWTKPQEGNADFCNFLKLVHKKRILLVTPYNVQPEKICCLFLQELNRFIRTLIEEEIYDDQDENIEVGGNIFWTLITNFRRRGLSQVVNSCFYQDSSSSLFLQKDCEIMSECKIVTKLRDETYTRTFQQRSMECTIEGLGNVTPPPLEYTIKTSPVKGEYEGAIIFRLIVPMKYFSQCVVSVNQDGSSQMICLRLKQNTDTGMRTPLVSFGMHGAENGLYDLSFTTRCPALPNYTGILHLIVVKHRDAETYRKQLPHHLIVILPNEFDNLGLGGMKFATQVLFEHFYETQSSCSNAPDSVWPFVLFMNDDIVMWSKWEEDKSPSTDSASVTGKWKETSLYEVMQTVESTCINKDVTAAGFRPWRSNADGELKQYQVYYQNNYLRESCLESCILINLKFSANVRYRLNRFTGEDIDWSLRAAAAGLSVCRFENISIATKVMTSSKDHAELKNERIALVTAADTDCKLLPFHPALLLETHLSRNSCSIFPSSKANPSHPVLCIDCYVSLGIETCVQFASTHRNSFSWSLDCNKKYGGILLNRVDGNVTCDFLQKFKFVEGATICLIEKDRSSLRQTVVNLNLEASWHFRLTDEYQTSNHNTTNGFFMHPWYFITGVKM